jgi:hypothetical protein
MIAEFSKKCTESATKFFFKIKKIPLNVFIASMFCYEIFPGRNISYRPHIISGRTLQDITIQGTIIVTNQPQIPFSVVIPKQAFLSFQRAKHGVKKATRTGPLFSRIKPGFKCPVSQNTPEFRYFPLAWTLFRVEKFLRSPDWQKKAVKGPE